MMALGRYLALSVLSMLIITGAIALATRLGRGSFAGERTVAQ